jgi:hypothetical protein
MDSDLKQEPKSRPSREPNIDDTASLSLSRRDRKKLGMDSWEPSLLRNLLTAQNRLKNRE